MANLRLLILCTLIFSRSLPSLDAQVVRESVSLDVDRAAEKKLWTIEDYLNAEQWADAVGLLTQVMNQHGDSLVRIEPRWNVRVTRYCSALLASLPPDALALCREHFDSLARRWWESGQSRRYPVLLRRLI